MAAVLAFDPHQHPSDDEAALHRDVERFLIPYFGPMRLSELTSRRLNAIFAEIGKASNRFGRPTSACTLQHIRTTLRAALNVAIREDLIADNPGPTGRTAHLPRPHPLVWTEQRITDWGRFGTRTPVWTPQQLAEFLDFVRDERLYRSVLRSCTRVWLDATSQRYSPGSNRRTAPAEPEVPSP